MRSLLSLWNALDNCHLRSDWIDTAPVMQVLLVSQYTLLVCENKGKLQDAQTERRYRKAELHLEENMLLAKPISGPHFNFGYLVPNSEFFVGSC